MASQLRYDYHKHVSDGTVKAVEKFFLYLDDPFVSKTSNLVEQHFPMHSSIFKRRFKTENGLLNISFLLH